MKGDKMIKRYSLIVMAIVFISAAFWGQNVYAAYGDNVETYYLISKSYEKDKEWLYKEFWDNKSRASFKKADFKDDNFISRLIKGKVIKNDDVNSENAYFDENIKNTDQLIGRITRLGIIPDVNLVFAIWKQTYRWRRESLTISLKDQIRFDIMLPNIDAFTFISNGGKLYEDHHVIKEIAPYNIWTFIEQLKFFDYKDFKNPTILKNKDIFDYSERDLKQGDLIQEIWYDEKTKLPERILNKANDQVIKEYFIYYNQKFNDMLFNPYIKSYEKINIGEDFIVKEGANSLNGVAISKGDKIVSIDKEDVAAWVKKEKRNMPGVPGYTLLLEVLDKATSKIKLCIIYQKDLELR